MPPKKVKTASSKPSAKAMVETEIDLEIDDEKGEVKADTSDIDEADETDEADKTSDIAANSAEFSELVITDNTQARPEENHQHKPVIYDEIIIRKPENRRTSSVMSIFEYAQFIGLRARQIEKGGPVFTDTAGITDPIEKAKKELADKRCPLSVTRMITDSIAEIWEANELELPH